MRGAETEVLGMASQTFMSCLTLRQLGKINIMNVCKSKHSARQHVIKNVNLNPQQNRDLV